MRPTFTRMVLILLACVCFSAVAFADTINVGIVGYDLLNPTGSSSGTTEFDIYNFTGANSLGADFPITTSLVLTNLTLTVKLSGGTEVFSLGSTSPGGSLSGPLFSTSDQILSATLTGTFSPTSGVAVSGKGTVSIGSSFSVTLLPSSGSFLAPGTDFVIITANTGATTVPEPSTWLMFASGVSPLLFRSKRLLGNRFSRRV